MPWDHSRRRRSFGWPWGTPPSWGAVRLPSFPALAKQSSNGPSSNIVYSNAAACLQPSAISTTRRAISVASSPKRLQIWLPQLMRSSRSFAVPTLHVYSATRRRSLVFGSSCRVTRVNRKAGPIGWRASLGTSRVADCSGTATLVVTLGLALLFGTALLTSQGKLMGRIESTWSLLGRADHSPLTCDESFEALVVDGPTRDQLFGPATESLRCLPPRLDHAAPGRGNRWPRAFCVLGERFPTFGDMPCN